MFKSFNFKELLLKDKKPFIKQRDLNWKIIKFSSIAILVIGVFILISIPESAFKNEPFHEKAEAGTLKPSNTQNDDPTNETLRQFNEAQASMGSIPRSLDYLYNTNSSSNAGGVSNQNDSMIIGRDGTNARNELKIGTRFSVQILDRTTISNQSMPVQGRIIHNISSDNNLAIESNSTILGDATFDEASGVATINWKSIILPNGSQRPISASAINSDGRIGVTGKIESEGMKNAVGQTITHFIGAYAEGSMSKGSFGSSEGGHKNGLKNAVAQTAIDRVNKMGEEIQKERTWIVLERGTECLAMLSQPYVFKEVGVTNGQQ